MHELMFTWKGYSPAVLERARRLLRYELGSEGQGAPVTVATMFARFRTDPEPAAQHLMRIAPDDAVDYLAEWIGGFEIDGEPCPAPQRVARAALAYAGRAV